MRKPAFYICENKDADQLRGNSPGNQPLCFGYIDNTIPKIRKIQHFKPLTFFCGCTALNAEDEFRHEVAHYMLETSDAAKLLVLLILRTKFLQFRKKKKIVFVFFYFLRCKKWPNLIKKMLHSKNYNFSHFLFPSDPNIF